MGPFVEHPTVEPGLLDRLLRRRPAAAWVADVEAVLARAADPTDVSAEAISAAVANVPSHDAAKVREGLADLYHRYLVACLADGALSDEQATGAATLRRALDLRPADAERVHEAVAATPVAQALAAAVADGALTDEETAPLHRLVSQLHLDEAWFDDLRRKATQPVLEGALHDAMADGAVSPDEWSHLQQLAADLRVRLDLDAKTEETITRMRRYWQLEHGDLPTVAVDVHLQRNETCHFATDASWWETRKVSNRVRYSGPTYRLRVAKGLYWRFGDVGYSHTSSDQWTKLDTGKVLLTDKRLQFLGQRNNHQIRLSRILAVQPANDGVVIEKDSGKNPLLGFDHDVDVFCLTLERLLKEQA